MNVAIYSESPADEAAIRVMVDAILGRATDIVEHVRIRPNGWTVVLQALPSILRYLHFHRPDADGLVIVVDSDESPIHQGPPAPTPCDAECRLCQINGIIAREVAHIGAALRRPPLKTAVGVASPAIEAWLLAGLNLHVTESAWGRGMSSGQRPFTKQQLKQELYGTTRPSLDTERKRMVEAAQRVTVDIAALERIFPVGFGSLMRDLRSW
jgi:hypothetical protein